MLQAVVLNNKTLIFITYWQNHLNDLAKTANHQPIIAGKPV